MKSGKLIKTLVVCGGVFAILHFLLGVESRFYAQEGTGLLRKNIRIGFPFWHTDLLTIHSSEQVIETPYSRYLKEYSPDIYYKKGGRWLLASGSVDGVLYSDKHKFISAGGFGIFPLPSVRDEKVYGFLVDATRLNKINPSVLSEVITSSADKAEERALLDSEYNKWVSRELK